MSGLLLPKTVSGRLAAQSMDERRSRQAAEMIANSSKTALSSDEFLTDADVHRQLDKLFDYIAAQREISPLYSLPDPVGWRLSFLILQPPDKTGGGLELPTDVTEAYAHKSMQGIVLDLGETAYKDEERFPKGAWVARGDRVVFKRYDAQVFELANGQKIGMINDTQPIAVLGRGWLATEETDE